VHSQIIAAAKAAVSITRNCSVKLGTADGVTSPVKVPPAFVGEAERPVALDEVPL
jgi:hypothetical protein